MAGHDTSFFSKGLDTGTGNRNLDLGALYSDLISKNKEKVIDDDIKIPTTYKELVDYYGGEKNIPQALSEQLGDIQPNVPEGFKITKRFGKDVLVPEDALATEKGRTFAGMIAGRYYGLSNIPTEFTQNLIMYNELYNTAIELSKLKFSIV